VQAILRGLKPCVIGIVLATGMYMVFKNCFGSLNTFGINIRAIVITVILVVAMFGYKKVMQRKLSPIMLIVLSAIAGIITYGI
jgi:chromate transporter